MGKITEFLEYERLNEATEAPQKRLKKNGASSSCTCASTSPNSRPGARRAAFDQQLPRFHRPHLPGPVGLACAQQLARAGHVVTVFKKSDRIGGLLRYSIPDFKLEKFQIDRRIVQMEAEGVEFSP